MICCDFCDNWYHCTCVGIDPDDADSMEQYICDNCQIINEEFINNEEDSDSEEDFELYPTRSSKKSTRASSKKKTPGEEHCSSKDIEIIRLEDRILALEQDLLFEDTSPSIHTIPEDKVAEQIDIDTNQNMELGLLPYPSFSKLRKILKENKLLDKSVSMEHVQKLLSKKSEPVPEECIFEHNSYVLQVEKYFHDSYPPIHSVPINADIRTFDFHSLIETQKHLTGQYFDCLVMDPPWQLSSANPTRGVAIAYQQLEDSLIQDIPVNALVPNGFLFLWVINAKYRQAFDMIKHWGFEYVDEISWVKKTRSGRLAKSHGFYLQHSKETCLVAKRGKVNSVVLNQCTDVIWAERTGQSQKPIDIYEIIEKMIPGGYFMEIFGRRNNLRNYWVTVGNEL